MSWLEALGLFRRPSDCRPMAAIEADIRAELEHHLQCAADELVAAGESPERARAAALERFGDLARVERDCLRLQIGERIMLQRLHFVATLLLFCAVAFLAWSNFVLREAERAREVALRAEVEQRLAALEALEAGRAVEKRPIASFQSLFFSAF